jgi:acyl-CoA thioesterase FadM
MISPFGFIARSYNRSASDTQKPSSFFLIFENCPAFFGMIPMKGPIMNLYIRFFWHLITAFFRPKMTDILGMTSLRFHVLPNDLDLNLHMNNGRYLTIMDIGRTDFVIRTGIFKNIMKGGYIPVLASANIRYRVQLEPFRAYDLQSRIVCWDEKWFFMEQRFVIVKGKKAGEIAAIAIVKGAFYDKKNRKTVPTAHQLHAVGYDKPSPAVPDYITKWVESENRLKEDTRVII